MVEPRERYDLEGGEVVITANCDHIWLESAHLRPESPVEIERKLDGLNVGMKTGQDTIVKHMVLRINPPETVRVAGREQQGAHNNSRAPR